MDWQAVGTIVALLGVIATLVLTLRGQKQDRTIAEATASRAEAAARLSDEYTSRVVEALEQMAASGGLTGAAASPAVRWSLTKGSGDSFRLENQGSGTAYEVTIEGHTSLAGPDVVAGDTGAVGPGEAIQFLAAMSLATSDLTTTVSWASEPGSTDRQQWRYPLPF